MKIYTRSELEYEKKPWIVRNENETEKEREKKIEEINIFCCCYSSNVHSFGWQVWIKEVQKKRRKTEHKTISVPDRKSNDRSIVLVIRAILNFFFLSLSLLILWSNDSEKKKKKNESSINGNSSQKSKSFNHV